MFMDLLNLPGWLQSTNWIFLYNEYILSQHQREFHIQNSNTKLQLSICQSKFAWKREGCPFSKQGQWIVLKENSYIYASSTEKRKRKFGKNFSVYLSSCLSLTLSFTTPHLVHTFTTTRRWVVKYLYKRFSPLFMLGFLNVMPPNLTSLLLKPSLLHWSQCPYIINTYL